MNAYIQKKFTRLNNEKFKILLHKHGTQQQMELTI